MPFLWIVTALCATLAALWLIFGVNFATGAPQEAAVAAIAAAIAVIPYVFTRAIGSFRELDKDKVQQAMTAALRAAHEESSATAGAAQVQCPECAELVRKEARVCKHCGSKLIAQG